MRRVKVSLKMQDILTNVLTSEDIEAEMRRLQSELAEDTKELIRIRTEYHQAEQCLQNWQGRFALAEGFQSHSLAPERDHRFFMAPIGSVVTDDADPSLINVTLLDSFKGSCANLESWDKAWVIGLAKHRFSSNHFPASDLLAPSSDIVSGPVGTITVSNVVFNYTEPYNNSVHISKYLIDNARTAGCSAVTEDQDPFTLGVSPQLPCYLEAAGEQAIQYELVNLLADIVAVDQETVRLTTSEPLPPEFVLLDLKVYHPYIEGLTNLLEHEKQ
eukprot:XP_001706847.1 Hypothetical protein GL50803_13940 [Giardia lamblia ATCC 50803]